MTADSKEIVFVTIAMKGGGTERVIATLSNFYVNNDFNVHILMISDSIIDYELDSRIDVRQIACSTGGSLKGRINRTVNLRKEIRKINNATVIAMGTVSSMFTSIALLGLENRLIISERNDPNRLNHRPIRWYEKALRDLLYGKANKIVFQTPMAKDCFSKRLIQKSDIIVNPLSERLPDIIHDNLYNREKRVVTAGRLTEQKNHRMLIEAFVQFHNVFNDYVLEIYGEGELKEELKDIVAQCLADDYIYILGYTKDFYSILSKTPIYVSTSNWEGVSNSVMEAMAMGCAVIATDCPMGGNAMLIENDENGILIHRESVYDLYLELCRLAGDEENRVRLANAAIKIRERADVSAISKQWID